METQHVLEVPAIAPAEPQLPAIRRYYVVSIAKFWTLYIGTFGLYGIYWFYRHWAQFKRATKGDEWPVMRAIFSVFFVHALFREINQTLTRAKSSFRWNPESLATWVVILLLTGSACNRLSANGIGLPITDYIGLAILPFIAMLKQQAQRAANASCDDPEGKSNSRFTAANITWLVFGGLFWILVLIGLLLGDSTAAE
jgi:hypothetical protein